MTEATHGKPCTDDVAKIDDPIPPAPEGLDEITRAVRDIVVAAIQSGAVLRINDGKGQDFHDRLITLVADTRAALDGSLTSEQLTGKPPLSVRRDPAVSLEESIQPDHLVCLEDGSRVKYLKRHLWRRYKMTPDQYRDRWGLPKDYPMVSPNYSAKRSEIAKRIGLGVRQEKGNA